MRVVTRIRCLGGFIGDQESKNLWLAEKLKRWTHSVDVLDKVACRHLQTAYAGLQKSIQQEWDFVHRVKLHTREAFRPVEEALEKSFLMALLRELRKK